jgi:hypothetical protein
MIIKGIGSSEDGPTMPEGTVPEKDMIEDIIKKYAFNSRPYFKIKFVIVRRY